MQLAPVHLSPVDYSLILIYFGFVLGIGWMLKKYMLTSSDFFLSGRKIPSWITGLAFLSANLGALEMMGMCASGAKYGMLTSHFYWIGAVPAMVFVGVWMMPFYYGSRARSVPEYLRLRFDERTRGLNAISFAVMTVLMSGINMYAMAKIVQLVLGWSIHYGILISAFVVLGYTYLGGLTSSIYNEVLQFFLIVLGFAPLTILGIKHVGGWDGLVHRIGPQMVSSWQQLGTSNNPLGVNWMAMVMGLGFVLSFGYWCTNFLVVQRAMAAKDMTSAQMTPIIAAFPKAVFPLLIIVPGMIVMALPPQVSDIVKTEYNNALPVMMQQFYPVGLLGLGITALLASFMSGMAGNVTAFNTVFTYDIYQSYIRPKQSDRHYLSVGRWVTVVGVLISIGTAYIVLSFNNLMDYVQLLFSFFNAPLFATFLLGMFWKRATAPGAFWGLLSGILAAMGHHLLTVKQWPAWLVSQIPALAGFKLPVIHYASDMGAAFYGAIYAWTCCFVVTIIISLMTPAPNEADLRGLVYALSDKPPSAHLAWYRRPLTWGIIVLLFVAWLNIKFW
jgi:SSS family solute:Na+ symporter